MCGEVSIQHSVAHAVLWGAFTASHSKQREYLQFRCESDADGCLDAWPPAPSLCPSGPSSADRNSAHGLDSRLGAGDLCLWFSIIKLQ